MLDVTVLNNYEAILPRVEFELGQTFPKQTPLSENQVLALYALAYRQPLNDVDKAFIAKQLKTLDAGFVNSDGGLDSTVYQEKLADIRKSLVPLTVTAKAVLDAKYAAVSQPAPLALAAVPAPAGGGAQTPRPAGIPPLPLGTPPAPAPVGTPATTLPPASLLSPALVEFRPPALPGAGVNFTIGVPR